MRKLKILALAAVLSLSIASTAFASSWKQDSGKWWYQEDDGSYPSNTWKEIKGKYYYFGADGYMLSNTVAPDGQRVGADGALIKTQNRSNITYSEDSVTRDLTILDWILGNDFSTYHLYEITNNSALTIDITINETGKNHVGSVVKANTLKEYDIPAGATFFMHSTFSDAPDVAEFDSTIKVEKDIYCQPVFQNISTELTKKSKKVIVKATNNGAVAIDFPEATAVFYKNGEPIDIDRQYLGTSITLQSGESYTTEMYTDGAYDEVKVHVVGRADK